MVNANKLVHSVRVDYSVTPVTTAAFVQIESSVPKNVRAVEVFDSSGSTLQLAYGPTGSEVLALQIIPGGNELRPLLLNLGLPLSLKAIDADALVGECVLNFFY